MHREKLRFTVNCHGAKIKAFRVKLDQHFRRLWLCSNAKSDVPMAQVRLEKSYSAACWRSRHMITQCLEAGPTYYA